MGIIASKHNTRNAPPAPRASASDLSSTIVFGAGCYWGTEKYIRKDFQKKFPNSIKSAKVGFMSPDKQPRFRKPTYKDVCTGRTGHVEVVRVELHDPAAHLEELIRFFFMFHDPTTSNRQGNDRGSQYASWIFCADEAQVEIATRVRDQVQQLVEHRAIKAYEGFKVTTGIATMTKFTAADETHQRYLEKHPNGYCNHRMRFKTWPMIVEK